MKKIFAMAALLLSGACLLGGCDTWAAGGSSSGDSSSSIEQSSSIEDTSDSSLDSSSDDKDSSVSSSDSISSDSANSADGVSSSDSTSADATDSSSSGNGDTTYKYTDFTAAEKALFVQYIGEVVPFIPNNEYHIEGAYEEIDYEHGINFYTIGNTAAEFETYINTAFTAYTKTETYLDDYNDLWYVFEKGDIVIDVAIYTGGGNKTYVDLYVYSDLSTDIDDSSWGGDDSSWDWGDSGDDSNDSSSVDLLTNENKGLPTGTNGVYNVDFTKAKYVKDVTDQGYYLDGCPTLSTTNKNPAVLVIPVEFSDVTAASKGYTIDTLKKAFNGKTGETDYYSVYDYYFTSSYGKLKLDITVLDDWFRPTNASTYYQKQTISYYGSNTEIGDQMVLNEALSYLDKTKNMDLSKFDSDGNGTIDAVILINTLTIDSEVTFNWAYRYWNIYTDSKDNYYEYDGVSANDYLWASYQFLFETQNSKGETSFDKTDAINTYTFIHEFGHVLGADDYYDTAYMSSTTPLAGHDVMDGEKGDHNAFTKFNYGWLTSSRLVVTEESVTLDLEAFSKNGDTILLANNWDDDLGAYQEYYIVVYYTNDGLNAGDAGYFDKEGILVYHVNASLYKETEDGETYYDVYNNNTNVNDTDGYGTANNLIEFVSNGYLGEYLFKNGDSLGTVTDDLGKKLAYTFTVDSLTDSKATLTFTKTK